MWAKPPNTLPGDSPQKHANDGNVLCGKCGKSNQIRESDRKAGKLTCKRCGNTIKIPK